MNEECVSQICFDERYSVPAYQTARPSLAPLPHNRGFPEKLIDPLDTSHLISAIESVCIREMQHHIDAGDTIVCTAIDMRHRATAPLGVELSLTGWVVGLDVERSVTFEVRLLERERKLLLSEGTVTMAVVPRARIGEPPARHATDAQPMDALLPSEHDGTVDSNPVPPRAPQRVGEHASMAS